MSDLAFLRTRGFGLSSCMLWLQTGLGTEPTHCCAFTRSRHPRLETGIGSERLPAPELAHPVLLGNPHALCQLVCQERK